MPAAVISRSAWAVSCALPKRQTWEISSNRIRRRTSPRRLTVSTSPFVPSVVPCSWTYSGKASSRAGVRRRTSRSPGASAASSRVSSGRQMPTSEQRGHLGLSSSGGGIAAEVAMARICPISSRVCAGILLVSFPTVPKVIKRLVNWCPRGASFLGQAAGKPRYFQIRAAHRSLMRALRRQWCPPSVHPCRALPAGAVCRISDQQRLRVGRQGA